jgi:hypothetical protein
MSVVRRLGQDALSNFLHAMDQQWAHWYTILSPAASCNLDDCHCLAFPSLSKLTSLDEEIIREVLCQCGLVRYRSNTGYSVMLMAWVELIREYQLEEVEVLHFFIMRKKRIYIRLGSWRNGIKKTPADELRVFRVEKAQLNVMARRRGLSQEQVRSLNEQREELDWSIAALDAQQKLLEKDASTKRAALSEAKKALKKIQSEKKKVDFSVVAMIQNLFERYEIKPAAYHGGKLNGVDCREVMKQASNLYNDIQTYLLTISHVNCIGTLLKLWTP